jgi:hypothetical protein
MKIYTGGNHELVRNPVKTYENKRKIHASSILHISADVGSGSGADLPVFVRKRLAAMQKIGLFNFIAGEVWKPPTTSTAFCP